MVMKKRGDGRGERRLKVKVRTARNRKLSSTRWLQRQLNDPYVAEAKRLGLRSRSAFKLMQMDDKHRFLTPGARVVDLGAAPGGWSEIAAKRVKAEEGKGKVVAVDMHDVEPIPGVVFLRADFCDEDTPERLREALDGPVDVVMSDMAAHASGHRKTDHLKIVALCEVALEFACDVLKPGGVFVAKALQGGSERELLAAMRRSFGRVVHVKPDASRPESSELYVLAKGFRDGSIENP